MQSKDQGDVLVNVSAVATVDLLLSNHTVT